jgi:tRNA (cmo5U34)-methyltransferase
VPNTDESTADTPVYQDVAESFASGAWSFTPDVVDVFDSHVRASVPFYDAIQDLVAGLSDWLVPQGGLVADLGAATGTTVRNILNRQAHRDVAAVLYDIEQPMLDQAAKNLAGAPARHIEYVCAPIQHPPYVHTDADLTLALFTLQFLPLRERVAALHMARMSARETGALIVAEKVRPLDSRWHEISTDSSHDWKASHGITPEGIRAKSRALRGVLQPHPQDTLIHSITAAGWHDPEILFRWHQWVVIGAFATRCGL